MRRQCGAGLVSWGAPGGGGGGDLAPPPPTWHYKQLVTATSQHCFTAEVFCNTTCIAQNALLNSQIARRQSQSPRPLNGLTHQRQQGEHRGDVTRRAPERALVCSDLNPLRAAAPLEPPRAACASRAGQWQRSCAPVPTAPSGQQQARLRRAMLPCRNGQGVVRRAPGASTRRVPGVEQRPTPGQQVPWRRVQGECQQLPGAWHLAPGAWRALLLSAPLHGAAACVPNNRRAFQAKLKQRRMSTAPARLVRFVGAPTSVHGCMHLPGAEHPGARGCPAAAPPPPARPRAPAIHRSARAQHPAPSTQHPAPSTQHPAPSTQHPAPSTQHPAPPPSPCPRSRAPTIPPPQRPHPHPASRPSPPLPPPPACRRPARQGGASGGPSLLGGRRASSTWPGPRLRSWCWATGGLPIKASQRRSRRAAGCRPTRREARAQQRQVGPAQHARAACGGRASTAQQVSSPRSGAAAVPAVLCCAWDSATDLPWHPSAPPSQLPGEPGQQQQQQQQQQPAQRLSGTKRQLDTPATEPWLAAPAAEASGREMAPASTSAPDTAAVAATHTGQPAKRVSTSGRAAGQAWNVVRGVHTCSCHARRGGGASQPCQLE